LVADTPGKVSVVVMTDPDFKEKNLTIVTLAETPAYPLARNF